MVNRVVVARSDGRGGLRIPVYHSKSLVGKTIMIGKKRLTVTTDGRVNIPKKVMDEYGTRVKDGRMAIAIDIGFRGVAGGAPDIGGYVNKLDPAKNWQDVVTGDAVDYTELDLSKSALVPTDGREYYTSGD